jgi:hypothetical protein
MARTIGARAAGARHVPADRPGAVLVAPEGARLMPAFILNTVPCRSAQWCKQNGYVVQFRAATADVAGNQSNWSLPITTHVGKSSSRPTTSVSAAR